MTLAPEPHRTIVNAILNGHFPQVRFLVRRDINDLGCQSGAAGARGRRAQLDQLFSQSLGLCARLRDQRWAVTLARCLLEYGTRVDLTVDEWKFCPLHYAIIYNRHQLVSLLLHAPNPGFRIHQKDVGRNTALHLAVMTAEDEIVNELIEFIQTYEPTSTVDPLDSLRRTPLMLAWMLSRFSVAESLIQAGANQDRVDCYGWSSRRYEEVARARMEISGKNSGRYSQYKTKNSKALPQFPEGDVPHLAFRLQKLHRPPTRAQRSYPLPTNLTQPLYRTPVVLHGLLPPPVLINTANPADRRNDPSSVFAAGMLNEFGLPDASWTELKKVCTFDRRDSRRPSTFPPNDLTKVSSWRQAIQIILAALSQQSTESYKYV
ncbi:Glycerophosphocholine phosphodiesterase [Sparganum proliferum]